jgi:hypothetical protein
VLIDVGGDLVDQVGDFKKDKENTHSHQDGDRSIQETKHLSHVPLLCDNGSKSILGPEKDLRTPAPPIEKKNLVVKEYHCFPSNSASVRTRVCDILKVREQDQAVGTPKGLSRNNRPTLLLAPRCPLPKLRPH